MSGVLVSEAQNRSALRAFMDTTHRLCRGAPAVPLAAALRQAPDRVRQSAAVVACGAKVLLAGCTRP